MLLGFSFGLWVSFVLVGRFQFEHELPVLAVVAQPRAGGGLAEKVGDAKTAEELKLCKRSSQDALETCLWVKHRCPKWDPGKWNPGLRHAVP